MPDNLAYMFGKMSDAITIVVTGRHGIRERVWEAAPYIFMVQPDGLPESCREDIERIRHMLTRYPPIPPETSALRATYSRTRSITAQEIAARAWTLCHRMNSELDARQARRS